MILITTLTELTAKQLDGGYDKVNVFTKEKDTVSVQTCQAMLDAVSHKRCEISLLPYTTREDIAFRLGTVLNTKDSFSISQSILKLPESIAKNYRITYLKPGETAKRKPRVRNTAQEAAQPAVPAPKEQSKEQRTDDTPASPKPAPEKKLKTAKADKPKAAGVAEKEVLALLQKTGLRANSLPESIGMSDRDFGIKLLEIITAGKRNPETIASGIDRQFGKANAQYIMPEIRRYLGN